MKAEDRSQIVQVLRGIPREEWSRFLDSASGRELQQRVDAVRGALRELGRSRRGAPPRPIAEIIDLLGYRLLSDTTIGPWLRQQILMSLPAAKWDALAQMYRQVTNRPKCRAAPLHGNMNQRGKGSQVMGDYWHQGGQWARIFCEIAGLPPVLAERKRNSLPKDEEIIPAAPLPPLHDFQCDVYQSLRRLLRDGQGRTAMMSLPTGAGKTRVTVEAICDHLEEEEEARRRRNLVLWIAQSNELQQQAWECFRQVWQVPPMRGDGEIIPRTIPLHIVRLWGGRKKDDVALEDDGATDDLRDELTVLVAGIDQLASWVRNHPEFFEDFPRQRLACVVIDEAHSLITREHRLVLEALQLRTVREWRPRTDAPPVIGLSATPWRTRDDESVSLRGYFQQTLVRPERLGHMPITALQQRGILSRVNAEQLKIRGTRPMTEAQSDKFEQFKELPEDYLVQLGLEPDRNARILERLFELPENARVLVFACSIAHAGILTLALNRACDAECAAVVTGKTPRAERAEVIARFRNGGLRFLCNVNVLTTGFDAPKANVVCMTRPTTSAIRYEQMVGRGLRGPKNGGTEECLVLDVQDEGLPAGIQSYARVLKLWEAR